MGAAAATLEGMPSQPVPSRRPRHAEGPKVRISPPPERPPVLALSGPGDLIDSVPYLIGFHPRDSLVLVGLSAAPSGRDRVGVTARVDLADVAVDGDIIDRCARALARAGSSCAVALIYDDEAGGAVAGAGASGAGGVAGPRLPWDPVIDEVNGAMQRAGIELRDALLVGRHAWWSYLCTGEDCCPSEGYPLASGGSAAAAAAAYAGLAVLPDRAALEALLEPAVPDERDQLAPMLERERQDELREVLDGRRARRRRSVVRSLFAAARADRPNDADPPPLDRQQLARLAVALSDISVRDSCWLAMEAGRMPPTGLWLRLARALPAPYDAQPLFLLGWQEWRAGNGALAGIAASRALLSDPGCSAAALLLDALAHGLDPRRTPRLRSSPRSTQS